jgi:hypothetical protein
MVNLIKLILVCCLAVPISGLSGAQGVTSTFDVMLYVNQDMPDKDRLVTHATAFQFPKQVTRFVRQKACQPWFKTNNADPYKTLSVVIMPFTPRGGWDQVGSVTWVIRKHSKDDKVCWLASLHLLQMVGDEMQQLGNRTLWQHQFCTHHSWQLTLQTE